MVGTNVSFADSVKVLSMTVEFSDFDTHVANIVRYCNVHVRALRHIRLFLSVHTAKSIALSIIASRLDYCNSLLYGISNGILINRQCILNLLSRTVLDAPWSVNAFKLIHSLLVNIPSRATARLSTGQTTPVISAVLLSKPAVASYFASGSFSTAIPSV